MSESVVNTPASSRQIDPSTALAISRALHSDLDLNGVMDRFHSCVTSLCSVTQIRYCNQKFELSAGEPSEYHLSYQPEFNDANGTKAGEFHFYAPAPFSEDTQALLEELLGLAARAFSNAHIHFSLTQSDTQAKQKSTSVSNTTNCKDALVVARLNGLKDLQQTAGNDMALRVVATLKEHLSANLRDADLTIDVDNEHIAIILPATSVDGAQEVANKLSGYIETITFLDPIERSCLSISTGISSTHDADTAQEVLERAKQSIPEDAHTTPATLH